MDPLRVALVASSYAPRVGGVEQHTAEVAALLQDRGHEVQVWTVARDGDPARRTSAGITVVDLPSPLPTRRLRGVASFACHAPGAWWRWMRAWSALRPDVLHVQCFGPNGLYAYGLGSLTRTPVVVSSHGETDADDNDIFRTSSLLPAGLRRAVRAARAVTACSPSVAADLTDNYGAAGVVVVPNGVEPIDLGPVARVPGRVVGVGRLEHNKGFDLLLRAMALVEGGDLLLVGAGKERGSLEALARSLGITHRVSFAGPLSQEATRRAVAASSVLVMPSRRESFGIVALEAWSVGTPLVATSRCGPAAFVDDGVDALLVDPCDIPALAASVGAVVADPALAGRLAAAGRARVAAYSWAAVVDRYEKLYGRVLAG